MPGRETIWKAPPAEYDGLVAAGLRPGVAIAARASSLEGVAVRALCCVPTTLERKGHGHGHAFHRLLVHDREHLHIPYGHAAATVGARDGYCVPVAAFPPAFDPS